MDLGTKGFHFPIEATNMLYHGPQMAKHGYSDQHGPMWVTVWKNTWVHHGYFEQGNNS